MQLKAYFKVLDTESKGYLTYDQVKDIIKDNSSSSKMEGLVVNLLILTQNIQRNITKNICWYRLRVQMKIVMAEYLKKNS